MGKFILYTVVGALATFAILTHLSLLPYLKQTPAFAQGVTADAVLQESGTFLMTLGLSWITWWSTSGLVFVLLYSLGKYTGIALFFLSLGVIFGVTVLIT